jgi:hypothetical protein
VLKKHAPQNRLGTEEKTFGQVMSEVVETKNTLNFSGVFWPAQCFACTKRKTDALNSFFMRSFRLTEGGAVDYRACKVCVQYAIRLSEMKKHCRQLERFFQNRPGRS